MQTHRSTYPVKRWDLRDVLVVVLILISAFLAAWIVKSEKTKYIVLVVEENIRKDVKFYKTNSKGKLEEWMIEKVKI